MSSRQQQQQTQSNSPRINNSQQFQKSQVITYGETSFNAVVTSANRSRVKPPLTNIYVARPAAMIFNDRVCSVSLDLVYNPSLLLPKDMKRSSRICSDHHHNLYLMSLQCLAYRRIINLSTIRP